MKHDILSLIIIKYFSILYPYTLFSKIGLKYNYFPVVIYFIISNLDFLHYFFPQQIRLDNEIMFQTCAVTVHSNITSPF